MIENMTWKDWKEELIWFIKECIDIYTEYYVKGKLEGIELVFLNGEDLDIRVEVAHEKRRINISEFQWNLADKERARECYFANIIWYDYLNENGSSSLDERMREICDELKEVYNGISVCFFREPSFDMC